MNKKIKVFDLIEMFYRKEKMPLKIKVSCYEFEYNKEANEYFNLDKNSNSHSLIQDWLNNASKLNNEVEILEDNKEEQEKLGESWKEVARRVGEWAKEFEQGFKESFTEIINYPFKNLEDNTEEIEGLKYEEQNLFDDKGNILETEFILRDEDVIKTINQLVKAVNEVRKDLNK